MLPIRLHEQCDPWRTNRVRGQAARSGYQSGGGERTASDRFRSGAEEVGSRLRRTASTVDHKFDLSGKAQKAATKMKEQARAVDSKFGIQYRLRGLGDDLQRQLPKWGKQYSQFSKTSLGQVVTTAFIVYLFASGLAFRLLNILFILWWLLPIIALPLARRKNQQAQARAAQQQRQQQSIFNTIFSGMGAGRNQQQSGGFGRQAASNSYSGKRRDYSNMADGPVIDAEWTTIDDEKT
ncbi:hypothetical protein WJX73_009412 [Symbiochloris irregularis]|uniref:Uncharacterized protein n=1 Tax=Symbiochloris irregularis TaxID=706552 RepID=A0AAW1NMC4_9CHLO